MALREALDAHTAPAAARRWLARRDYSRHELSSRLQREGLGAQEAEALVAELADGFWQCDVRFAETLVRTRARQGKGPRMVRAEFFQHQLDESDFRRACRAAEVDWHAAAFEALRRTRHTEEAKLRQVLSRKGFFSDQIRDVIKELQG